MVWRIHENTDRWRGSIGWNHAEYSVRGTFDLIVLATKAQGAIEVAPSLVRFLAPGGTLLPVQNGGVPQMLASRLGDECVLGGLSNLGATMLRPGIYEQRNAGYLLIGELGGGESKRSERVPVAQSCSKCKSNSKSSRICLVQAPAQLLGYHAWSDAVRTMREYIDRPEGR
jgi:Ketopantoate reductase PanE/ApbA